MYIFDVVSLTNKEEFTRHFYTGNPRKDLLNAGYHAVAESKRGHQVSLYLVLDGIDYRLCDPDSNTRLEANEACSLLLEKYALSA